MATRWPARATGTTSPGATFEPFGSAADLGFDSRRHEQQIDNYAAVGFPWRQNPNGRQPVERGLFQRHPQRKTADGELADQRLGRQVVGHRDGQVDISRKSRLNANGDREATDQGPRLAQRIEDVRGPAKRRQQACRLGFVTHSVVGRGPSPCCAPGRSCSHWLSRISTSRSDAFGRSRRMDWRRSDTPVAHRSSATRKRSIKRASSFTRHSVTNGSRRVSG